VVDAKLRSKDTIAQVSCLIARPGNAHRPRQRQPYVTDRTGLNWEIPMSDVCGVPEGHVFSAHLGSTSEPNPCLACGVEIIVPYQGPKKGQPQVNRKPAAPPASLILELLAKSASWTAAKCATSGAKLF
jgi:hypothetical protein